MARVGYFLVAVAILASSLTFEACAEATSGKIELQHGWRLIRDDDAKAAQIDVPNAPLGDAGYAIQTMPSTVLNALSKAGVYKDIYYGDNLTKVETPCGNTNGGIRPSSMFQKGTTVTRSSSTG
ncbi:hypothetical protein [Ochrobactrum teleogrylli]